MREIQQERLPREGLMSRKTEILSSFIMYGLGIASFLGADIYIVAVHDKPIVAEWAYYKSIIIIAGSMCLLGYDQVLIRDPGLTRYLFKRFSINSVCIAGLASALICIIEDNVSVDLILIFVNILLFSYLLFFASAARSTNNLLGSQFATNFWRFLLLVYIVLAVSKDVPSWYFVPLVASFTMSAWFYFYSLPKTKLSINHADIKNANTLGFFFFLHNMTLITATYGEQLLVNLMGDKEASFILFSHFAVFTPVALGVNGFIGFYLGPKLKRTVGFTTQKYLIFSTANTLFSICICILSVIVGGVSYSYIYEGNAYEINKTIVLLLFFLCLARNLYTLPSACLGVFGSAQTIYLTARINWVLLVLYISMVILFLFEYSGESAAEAVAFLSLLHWILRLFCSNYYAMKTLKTHRSS